MTSLWLVPVLGLIGGIAGFPCGAVAGMALARARQLPLSSRVTIVLSTAVLFAFAALVLRASWVLPAVCVFAAVAVVLGAVDLIEKRLPNAVLYPSLVVLMVLLAFTSLITGSWGSFLSALGAGAGLFALYFVLAVISPTGIGMGDVKLAALIGLVLGYLGWTPLLVGATAGFLIGGVTSLIALLSGRAGKRTMLPFGPAMIAGTFLGMLVA